MILLVLVLMYGATLIAAAKTPNELEVFGEEAIIEQYKPTIKHYQIEWMWKKQVLVATRDELYVGKCLGFEAKSYENKPVVVLLQDDEVLHVPGILIPFYDNLKEKLDKLDDDGKYLYICKNAEHIRLERKFI